MGTGTKPCFGMSHPAPAPLPGTLLGTVTVTGHWCGSRTPHGVPAPLWDTAWGTGTGLGLDISPVPRGDAGQAAGDCSGHPTLGILDHRGLLAPGSPRDFGDPEGSQMQLRGPHGCNRLQNIGAHPHLGSSLLPTLLGPWPTSLGLRGVSHPSSSPLAPPAEGLIPPGQMTGRSGFSSVGLYWLGETCGAGGVGAAVAWAGGSTHSPVPH